MKIFFAGVTILSFLLLFAPPIFAESSYVLPYPSFMPGNALYVPSLLVERMAKYWYFGNFGQFKYSLKKSDKYLVEAKTLFEYKQYLLAYKALERSNSYFVLTFPHLVKAEKEGKNIINQRSILNEGAKKHIEVLSKLHGEVPEMFVWQEEKSKPISLYLKKTLWQSIMIRRQNL